MKTQFTIKQEVDERHYIAAITKLIYDGKKVTKKSIEESIYFNLRWYGDVEYWSVQEDEYAFNKAQETFNRMFKK